MRNQEAFTIQTCDTDASQHFFRTVPHPRIEACTVAEVKASKGPVRGEWNLHWCWWKLMVCDALMKACAGRIRRVCSLARTG